MDWISSYQNHVVHSSVYIAIAAFSIQSALKSESTAWQLFHFFCSLLTAWALKAEVLYVMRRSKLPPGDSGWPLLGHLPTMVAGNLGEKLLKAQGLNTMCTINVAMTPTMLCFEDDDVAWVQVQERKGHTVPLTIPHVSVLLGDDTIIYSSGSHHKHLRRMLEPAFQPQSVKTYTQLLDTTVQEVLNEWGESKGFRSLEDVAKLAMKLFFVCAMGKVDEQLIERLNYLFTEWFKGFLMPIPIAYPGGVFKKAFEMKKEIEKLMMEVVSKFKKENPPESPLGTKTLLGRLCYGKDDEGNGLSDIQLIQNVYLIVFAGHDTTKGSFGSAFYYLSENPYVADLLIEEAKTFQEPLNYDELKDAPILNSFLAETWRLMAPVSHHSNLVVKDLEYKGYHIPKGTGVGFVMQAAHYDEKRFHSPNEFRIERWLPKGHALHSAEWYAEGVDYNTISAKYRTFGGGMHMCLGMHFAKLEARIVLTRLVQKYSLEIRNSKLVKFPLRHMSCDFKLTERKD